MRDGWIVCVCVFVRAYPEGERGRVTKKGEVTMPKACWDSAQGSRGAKKCRRQKGVIHATCWSQTKQKAASLEAQSSFQGLTCRMLAHQPTVPSRAANNSGGDPFLLPTHAEWEKPDVKMV